MTNPAPITLERFDATSPRFLVAQQVYAATYPEDDPQEIHDDFARAAAYRNFIGLVAYRASAAVGVGFGARVEPGIWWYDQIALIVGADHPALQDAWRLFDLAVVPSAQGSGVGGALHDALLAAQPCPVALINTLVDNTRARTIYANRGWTQLAPPMLLPGRTIQNVVYWRTCHVRPRPARYMDDSSEHE